MEMPDQKCIVHVFEVFVNRPSSSSQTHCASYLCPAAATMMVVTDCEKSMIMDAVVQFLPRNAL